MVTPALTDVLLPAAAAGGNVYDAAAVLTGENRDACCSGGVGCNIKQQSFFITCQI